MLFLLQMFSCFLSLSEVSDTQESAIGLQKCLVFQELLFKFYWDGFKETTNQTTNMSSFSHLCTSGKYGCWPEQPTWWGSMPRQQWLPSHWEHMGIPKAAVVGRKGNAWTLSSAIHYLSWKTSGVDSQETWVTYKGYTPCPVIFVSCGHLVQCSL